MSFHVFNFVWGRIFMDGWHNYGHCNRLWEDTLKNVCSPLIAFSALNLRCLLEVFLALGHLVPWHDLFWLRSPHFRPMGEGWRTTTRFRDWMPAPQVALHLDHSDHLESSQSTTVIETSKTWVQLLSIFWIQIQVAKLSSGSTTLSNLKHTLVQKLDGGSGLHHRF